MWIKGIQIGNHDIGIVNFSEDTTIFLRGFSCLTKIELTLELCEKTSASKISFSKSQTLWGVAYKMVCGKKPGHNSPLK